MEELRPTPEEREKYLAAAFESMEPLRLRALPSKPKRRFAVLERIAEEFEPGRHYGHRETLEKLTAVWAADPVAVRRFLIVYGMLDRKPDGSDYWRIAEQS